MQLNDQQKEMVLKALNADQQERQMSQNAYAKVIGLSPASLSQLRKGVLNTIRDAEWIRIARTLEVDFKARNVEWVIAPTAVVEMIDVQLHYCMEEAAAGIFCDKAGIGKTAAAKRFAAKYKQSAVYIDCSLAKSKVRFIRTIADKLGVHSGGKVVDVLMDVMYALEAMENPILIFDEAGDLEYSAFLELKAMYNRLEGVCGFYMLGADGLKAKIERCVNSRKVGYAEILDRFGATFQDVMPDAPQERSDLFKYMKFQILEANGITDPQVKQELAKISSLRRLKVQIRKMQQGGLPQ